ncbi:hypothetical protein [Lysinibacillus parviboronicapiens]|uniref:hypothetical protein n=1 Tax=Lysinibacillus parviboronicapiens TaxID=436516 RepID=UPI000D3711A0|nr:hypothetical protein [Lysinibacillus parviboronicapiens]
MSKYGVEVLKDLKDSKNRVMMNVINHIEQRKKPKPSRRRQYSILTMILTVCIGVFVYNQHSEKNLLSSNDVQILDEELLSMSLKLGVDSTKEPLNPAFQERIEESLNSAFQARIEIDAYYAYALSKGIVLRQAAIDEQERLTREHFESISKDAKFIEDLSRINITPEKFYEEYMKPDNIKLVAYNELLKDYFKKYEESFQLHARFAVKKDAIDYFTSQYKEEISNLEKKYQLSSNPSDARSFNKQYKFGQIVAVEGDRFLVVSGALEEKISHLPYTEIIEKKQNGVWFPLHGVKDKIAVGKQVNITYTMKDDTISQGYDFAANLDEIEIIE